MYIYLLYKHDTLSTYRQSEKERQKQALAQQGSVHLFRGLHDLGLFELGLLIRLIQVLTMVSC